MAQRVTTQQLHDTLTEGFHSIDKRLSTLERDVQGSNGEGLWDMIKQLRKEYREGAERHREEHRRMWERITEIERRGVHHRAETQGEKHAHAEAKDDAHGSREEGRRRVEVVGGLVVAGLAALQITTIIMQWGGS